MAIPLERVLLWLRQLICIHGPFGRAESFMIREPGQPYRYDFCKRCLKITTRYYTW